MSELVLRGQDTKTSLSTFAFTRTFAYAHTCF